MDDMGVTTLPRSTAEKESQVGLKTFKMCSLSRARAQISLKLQPRPVLKIGCNYNCLRNHQLHSGPIGKESLGLGSSHQRFQVECQCLLVWKSYCLSGEVLILGKHTVAPTTVAQGDQAPSLFGSQTWYWFCRHERCKFEGLWNLALWFQGVPEARQYVAGLESWQEGHGRPRGEA